MIYEYDQKAIAGRIRDLRKNNNLTRKQFASQIGISVDNLKKKELGENPFKLIEIISICNEFNIEIDYLLGRIDAPTKRKESIRELLHLSEKSCDIIADFLEDETEDEIIEHFLQGEPIINALSVRKFLSWIVEHGGLQIINDIATLSDAFWSNEKETKVLKYVPFDYLSNIENQFILQIIYNEKLLINLIDLYASIKR